MNENLSIEKDGINVLSLFDGMSCGRIALGKLGIKVNNYFSCEIDKYALKVANDNFPVDEINRLGDVTKVNFSDLPKIDLVIGGSPCQGFSFAGKQLAFDDPRSKLFFEFVRAIKETNPTYFMLENVRMKKEFQGIISEYMGVEPICINSTLVSAQNRVRYYWTNIPEIKQPEDRNIYLKDIIENGSADRDKSLCVTTRVAGATAKRYLEKKHHQMIFTGPPKVGRMVGRKINPETGKRDDYNPDLKTEQRIEPRLDDKSGTLTTVTKDNLVINKTHWRKLTPLECERLQTVPDNYTKVVSNSQSYKMLGNGWTVDVIAHIFKNMKFNENKLSLKEIISKRG